MAILSFIWSKIGRMCNILKPSYIFNSMRAKHTKFFLIFFKGGGKGDMKKLLKKSPKKVKNRLNLSLFFRGMQQDFCWLKSTSLNSKHFNLLQLTLGTSNTYLVLKENIWTAKSIFVLQEQLFDCPTPLQLADPTEPQLDVGVKPNRIIRPNTDL